MFANNPMKAKLRAGQPVFGVQIEIAAPELVEASGHLGFDWVFLDAEHGLLTESDVAHLVRAAESAGIVPIVRVPRNEPATILRYLETGALGIVVPQVNSGEEARAAVAAAKYPPVGQRGIGISRASGFGLRASRDEYRQWANAEMLVIALVENLRGVENLDAILAVEGLDVIFVGPADLAASLGVPIDFEHPEVRRTVDSILRRTLAAGRVAGVNTGPMGTRARQYVDEGVRCLVTGAWGLVAAGARSYLDAAREEKA